MQLTAFEFERCTLMKIGILSNPLSRRNRKDLDRLRVHLKQHESIVHIELGDFATLGAELRRLSAAGVEILVINGGDGTVSAVLTEIFENKVFDSPPLVAITPGGTSNTIAADVGLRGDRLASLLRLLDISAHGASDAYQQTRTVIRVSYDPNRSAVFGMFFGTAAVCDAIKLRRRLFPQVWLPDALAGGLSLCCVLAKSAFGGPNAGGLLPPKVIHLDADGRSAPPQDYTVVIISTLKQIFLGSFPFWDLGPGQLNYTTIRSPAAGLLRYARRLLYARDKSTLPGDTYASGSANSIVLQMDCPFNLDGEFFSPVGPVSLTAVTKVRFISF